MPQHQALLATPGADHMQRRSGACRIEGAAQRLAVDGNHANFVHNEYLQIAAGAGLVGELLLLAARQASAKRAMKV